MEAIFHQIQAVIVSDYGYGLITPAVIHALGRLQKSDPKLLLVDSKDLSQYRGMGLTVVKPNYPEALSLLGISDKRARSSRVETISERGNTILDLTGSQIAAVTLDADGALIFERNRPVYRTYAKPGHFPKPVGAGDTFISAFALALASDADTPTAAEIASAASSVVVEKMGTAPCYWSELKEYFYGDDKIIQDVFFLAARVASYKKKGMKIVFTNGCFDILHRGHISYLNMAKRQGDILIIGINSDNSVRGLKGPNRPVNSLEDRSQILAALSSVDHIVPFDGSTPVDLIRVIQPDVFVKGGDYTRETLPEASLVEELGGTVRILPYLEDRSTSGMIERINRLYTKEHISQHES
jgi:D-beta-D-heptose 7-phosphate kinase/D-beta-D-heptose 1-phosphate adenosyltransferase